MKAISLWQPWASALFTPLKPDETRHWVLPDWAIGVPIAIHAAQRDTAAERDFWRIITDGSDHEKFRDIGIGRYEDLPRGCILGTVVFASAIRTQFCRYDRSTRDREWGNYADDRFAWPVVSRNLFPTPIPCIGRQGFFNWKHRPARGKEA